MANERSEPIKAPLARVSFAQFLFKPNKRQNDDGSTSEKFEATFIFEAGADLSELKKAAVEVATAKWGEKAAGWIKDGMIKNPFLDGGGKQARSQKTGELHPGMGEGKTFIRTQSQYQPPVVDQRRLPITDPSKLPSGSLVYPVVHIFAWENKKQGKGLSFGIDAVQLVKDDGTRFGGGGGANPDDFFEKIEDDGGPDGGDEPVNNAADLFG